MQETFYLFSYSRFLSICHYCSICNRLSGNRRRSYQYPRNGRWGHLPAYGKGKSSAHMRFWIYPFLIPQECPKVQPDHSSSPSSRRVLISQFSHKIDSCQSASGRDHRKLRRFEFREQQFPKLFRPNTNQPQHCTDMISQKVRCLHILQLQALLQSIYAGTSLLSKEISMLLIWNLFLSGVLFISTNAALMLPAMPSIKCGCNISISATSFRRRIHLLKMGNPGEGKFKNLLIRFAHWRNFTSVLLYDLTSKELYISFSMWKGEA
jgi:hypothetical protein